MDAIKLEWRRECASSKSLRLAILLSVGALACGFALFLWWFVGAWFVLPFAGIEIACVAAAFWWFEQSLDDSDTVEIANGRVTIVSRRRRRLRQTSMPRDWLSTELCDDQPRGRRVVRLRRSGRSVDVLEFLSMTAQQQALRELRVALATHH